MTFSIKLPAGKKKQKPLATSTATTAKQYGLILPKKEVKKKDFSTNFNVFAAATQDNNKAKIGDNVKDAKRQVEAEALRSLQPNRVDKLRAQALAEDASVFEYDSVYDNMKKARDSEAEKRAAKREQEKKKPKYISTLLQQAKIREVENERIRERRLLNERKADDALYGDKEKLVSASYKRKLQEMQRWDAEDARLAAQEEREDVARQGENAIAAFYANLNKNIAMGGSTENAQSAYTAKDARHVATLLEQPIQANIGHELKRRRDGSERLTTDNLSKIPAAENASGREQINQNQQSPLLHDDSPDHKVVGASADVSLPQQESTKLSKEDAIAAARVRFLARKAQRKSPKEQ